MKFLLFGYTDGQAVIAVRESEKRYWGPELKLQQHFRDCKRAESGRDSL